MTTGGGEQPGCDPALSIGGVRHPRWGGERGEPGLYLLRGSVGHLFFQLLVVAIALQPCGGDVLQPCRGRRTPSTLRAGSGSQPGLPLPIQELEVTVLGDHQRRGATGLCDENP